METNNAHPFANPAETLVPTNRKNHPRRHLLYIFGALMLLLTIAGVAENALRDYAYTQENVRSGKESDEILNATTIQLYIPEELEGKYKFEGFSFNVFSDPSYLEYTFTHYLHAAIYTAPSYFNPPHNCGQKKPTSTNSSTPFPCTLAAISPKGRPIYAYTQKARLKRNPNAEPEYYFTKIDNTVVSIYNLPKDINLQDIIIIVDSLKPATIAQLKAMDRQARDTIKKENDQADKLVKFDIYAPKNIPKGYKLTKTLLGNQRNRSNPEMVFILISDAESKSGLTAGSAIIEFKSGKPFNPPMDCGQSSAENEDQFDLKTREVRCELKIITPGGVNVYGDSFKSYFMLGSTKISISSDMSNAQIAQIVDGMVKTPLDQISYEKYK